VNTNRTYLCRERNDGSGHYFFEGQTPQNFPEAVDTLAALVEMAREHGLAALVEHGPITPDELRPYMPGRSGRKEDSHV
jgi:hypothetical protein